MDMCGYAFANVGDEDSASGLPTLRTAARALKLRWLSSNVLDASTGKPSFLTAGEVRSGKTRIGVLGILDDSAVKGGYAGRGDYRLQDPADSILKAVDRSGMRRWAHIIVVLAHAPLDRIKLIAEKVPGISLIVGGSQHDKPPQPQFLNGAIFIQPHKYQVGLVRFRVDGKAGARAVSWKLFTVPKNAPKDPRVEAMISSGLKRASNVSPPRIGQEAPDIALPSENGALKRLADFRGSKVVLGFYDFCPDCVDTATKLARLPGKPVLVGIVSFGKRDMQQFRRITNSDMIFLHDAQAVAALRYAASKCPSLFLISEKGILLYARPSFDPSAADTLAKFLQRPPR